MKPMLEAFYNDVYNIVSQIPEGRVMTYGVIADLMGWGKHQRMVGKALKKAPSELNLPCHRVVSSNGAPFLTGQSRLICCVRRVFLSAMINVLTLSVISGIRRVYNGKNRKFS